MRRAAMALLLTLLPSCRDRFPAADPERELAALRSVNDSYREAWLAGDSTALLQLFTPDAVLLPHDGDPPVVGLEAIRQFWWPAGAPATTVTALDLTAEGARIDGAVGTLWGRFTLAFSYQDAGQPRSSRNAGTYLMVLRRQPDGEWRISHRMWDDPPAQVE